MNTSSNEAKYIGIDLGTTHIKSGVFDDGGTLLEILKTNTPMTKDDFGQIYDPCQIYGVVHDQVAQLLERYENIYGITITGMAEAGLIIHRRKGMEETPIIPWFDTRTVELAKQVQQETDMSNFYTTGLRNSYKYGIYKYLWLLNQRALKPDETIWLSACDYIVWKLTGQFVTTSTLAARTYVYDIINQDWDKDRIAQYGLTEQNFPKVVPSGEMVGYLSDQSLLQVHKNPIMVCLAGHDHVCATYAVLNDGTNQICNSIGTAETYLGIEKELCLTKSHYDSGIVYGPYINSSAYFWMANISSSGQSIEWFRKQIQKSEISYREMNEMLSSISDDPTNILYYPYLSGIGTPLFQTEIGGSLIGLRVTHETKDILKAILEGINYQGKWILSLVPGMEKRDNVEIICVGGATSSDTWMNIKANILGIPVMVPNVSEATLLGAVAIMINKNLGSSNRVEFLKNSQDQKQIFKVNKAVESMYEEIYINQYTFLIDMMIKRGMNRKDRG